MSVSKRLARTGGDVCISATTSGGVDSQTEIKRLDRRRQRMEAQQVLWDVSSLKRLKNCGRHCAAESGLVAVKVTRTDDGAAAGFGGVATCGSVWACPVCASKILQGRRSEVGMALERWQGMTSQDLDGAAAPGGSVGFVTLTMRHHDGQALGELWDALSKAWHAVTSGRAWVRNQAEFGSTQVVKITRGKRKGMAVIERRLGWLRVVEVTHGDNGWHVHVHAALFLPADTSGKDFELLGDEMFTRWRDKLTALGLDAPLKNAGGLHSALMTEGTEGALMDYFTKNEYSHTQAATELTRADLKQGRKGNRTPFQILADFYTHHDMADLDLWHEWEAGSHNRRQMTWAAGFRDWLKLGNEATDEELAEDDSLNGEAVAYLDRKAWRKARWIKADVLDLAEAAQSRAALAEGFRKLGLVPVWPEDVTARYSARDGVTRDATVPNVKQC